MSEITNGYVLELYNKYLAKVISKLQFFDLIRSACSSIPGEINEPATIAKLHRLKSTYQKKKRNRKEFLNINFTLPTLPTQSIPPVPCQPEEKTYKDVATALAVELQETKSTLLKDIHTSQLKGQNLKAANLKLKYKLEERRKVVKQTQQRLKQCHRKIQRQVQKKLSKSFEPPLKKIKLDSAGKHETQWKGKYTMLAKENKRLTHLMDELGKQKNELITEVSNLQSELSFTNVKLSDQSSSLHYAISLLNDVEDVQLYDEDKRCYTTECMTCVMNLDNLNVANNKISSVIKEVLKLVGQKGNKLPSATTVNNMVQAKGLVSQKHLKAVLPSEESTTLYTDETRKFAKSYNVYLATTEENTFMLGLREMSNKSAQTCLDTFKEILEDISNSTGGKGSTETGNKILLQIKNTMSDRAATEVAFNRLLEDYRKGILPQVVDNWHLMSTEEQDSCSHLNNFFCGLHLLVSFADLCAASLLKFEKTYYGSKPVGAEAVEELKAELCYGGDAACIRVIRAASQCFSRGGDEKSGCFGAFIDFCKDDKVRFVRFRGNRFNVIFLLGQVLYYHRKRIKHFLEEVHGAQNHLQKAILADIQVPIVVAGCKVLGLISKLVTAPLWRILESHSRVLDLNAFYKTLVDFLDRTAKDASLFLTGVDNPFPDQILKDEVLVTLLEPDEEIDKLALPISQTLCTGLHQLLQRMTADHLPGGKFWEISPRLQEEAKSVKPHNKLPEFVFGQLDFFLRYRPHTSTLTNESFLMYSMNKTGKWLESLDPKEREELLVTVRLESGKYKEIFQERCRQIQADRLQALQAKEKSIKEKKRRDLKIKEKLTHDVVHYGLWQSPVQMDLMLGEIGTDKAKIEALTAQLKFRKSVLKQDADKSLFALGKTGEDKKYHRHTVTQLKCQVLQLITMSFSGPTVEQQRSGRPLLVGKHVNHTFDEGSWVGHVVSVVPGYPDWYNIVYKDDDAVYTYKLLEDYHAGNLAILTSDPEMNVSDVVMN